MRQHTSQIRTWLSDGLPDINRALDNARRCIGIDPQEHADELREIQGEITQAIHQLQLRVASGPTDEPQFRQQQHAIATEKFQKLHTRYVRLRPHPKSSVSASIDECLNNHRACIAHLLTLEELTTVWSRNNDDTGDSSFDEQALTDLLAQLDDADAETDKLQAKPT